MIDMHCHVIYGVDDGPRSADEALAMLRMAYADGIRAVIATPHYSDACRSDGLTVAERAGLLSGRLRREGLDIGLYTGNECALDDGLLGELSRGRGLTLAGSRYVLTEISACMPRVTAEKLLSGLLDEGFKPIIAHFERLVLTKRDIGWIDELAQMGCLMQLNAETVLLDEPGWFREWTYLTLEDGTVSFVASDGHDPVRRRPLLSEAYERVTKLFGAKTADGLFFGNAVKILGNVPNGTAGFL